MESIIDAMLAASREYRLEMARAGQRRNRRHELACMFVAGHTIQLTIDHQRDIVNK